MTVNYFIQTTIKKNHDYRTFNNSETHKETIPPNPWYRRKAKIKTDDIENSVQ